MKGYIYVYDKRSAILKNMLIDKGFEIVDDIRNDLDFCFLKDQIVNCKYSFSLGSNNSKYVMNNNYLFRHFNNLLTAIGVLMMILDRNVKDVLIIGYGDLAKWLAKLLKNYNVVIANRDNKDHEEIIKNYLHLDIHNLYGKYDVVINTVPIIKIDYSKLDYGIIYDLANSLDLDNYISIRNVPDLYFPKESALLMLNYILDVMSNV